MTGLRFCSCEGIAIHGFYYDYMSAPERLSDYNKHASSPSLSSSSPEIFFNSEMKQVAGLQHVHCLQWNYFNTAERIVIIALFLCLQSMWDRPSIEQHSFAPNESLRSYQPSWSFCSWNHLHAHRD